MPRSCKAGWLQTYLNYTANVESPEEFHLWSGISAIAGTLGRNVWVDFDYFPIFPSMYIVLVGPSGSVRKSTAGGIAMRLFKSIMYDKATIFDGKMTMPAFFKDMASMVATHGESRGYIYASEFRVFTDIGPLGNSIRPDMTHFWDCPDTFTHRTKIGGNVELRNVSVNLLSCSTPEWLAEAGGKDFVESGFSSRILYILKGWCDRRITKPRRPQGWEVMEQALRADLLQISRLQGEFKMTDEGYRVMDEWYQDKEKNFSIPDERMAMYVERKQTHMLKIAMVLAAGLDDKLELNEHHISAAIKMLETIEPAMRTTYQHMGAHDNMDKINRVIKVLSKVDKVTFQFLMSKLVSRMNDKDLEGILRTLIAANVVVAHKKVNAGNAITYYSLNSLDKLELCGLPGVLIQ